jgi:UDP-glucose 4-epimerase
MRELSHALVLGGSGFIGSWLVERLLDEGVEVTVLDHATAVTPPEGTVRRIDADVTEESVEETLAHYPVDAVFHLANAALVPPSVEGPMEDLEGNIVTVLAALEGLRRARSDAVMVFVSSAAVYGDAQYQPMDEDHPLEPKSPYGVSKLAAERYVRLYARLHGLPGLSIRPFSVYGPRQRKLVVYDLLTRLHEGERPLRMLGSADVTRDFVFVEDAARALVGLARAASAGGEAYNLASGRSTSLQELATTLVEVSCMEADLEFTGEVRAGDPLHWTGDPRRARALGVRCDTPLVDGLRRTAEWFAAARAAGK